MSDERKQQGQTNTEENLDKNKTLNNPEADVIDYGRSEQKAVENSKKDGEKQSDKEKEQNRERS